MSPATPPSRHQKPEPAPFRAGPTGPMRWGLLAVVVLLGGAGVASMLLPQPGSEVDSADPVEATPVIRPSKKPAGPAPEGMVWIPGGQFWMGDPDSHDAPLHQVEVDGFWMDQTEVTNAQFARFVEATGYVTVAERKPAGENLPPEFREPWSIVFTPPEHQVGLENHLVWWKPVPGANWRHPEGPGSSIEDREDHPVVHVCYEDALAYAEWAGKRLPTEAEWEFASRGGLDQKPYAWGDELLPGGKWQANIWQGKFPTENTADDGFIRTAPVASFPANGFGLHDMSGNVWEWCSDWYRLDAYLSSARKNPQGPKDSFDPQEPGIPKRVQRGGSFLCSDAYCVRYRMGTRGKGDVQSGTSHVGFRCVKGVD